MKEITDQKFYQCEFCNKISLNKGAMIVHERCCRKNPKNCTPCASCRHLKKVNFEVEGSDGSRCKHCANFYGFDYEEKPYCHLEGDCDGKTIVTDFICERTGNKMYYPRKVLMMRKDKREAIISRCDCAMPDECDFQKRWEF